MKLKWLIKELQKFEKKVGGDAVVMAYDEFRADYRDIDGFSELIEEEDEPGVPRTIYINLP